MQTQTSLESPRLIALQQAITNGDETAISTFWQEMAEQGTPLIEPIEGDDGHRLVTFLWRAETDLDTVIVISDLVSYDFRDNQMTHMPDTDIWYRPYQFPADTRSFYKLSPNGPAVHWSEIEDWGVMAENWQLDPLNPHELVFEADDENPDSQEMRDSIIALPDAPPQPWITPQSDNPVGKVECHHVRSEILDNERRVWVYTPPGYTADHDPYGLLLLFDGWDYTHVIPAPTILDNLLAGERIPPLVAVFIDNVPGQRAIELRFNEFFNDFLIQELLPWVRQDYHVTTDPAQTIVGGLSNGGLAAVFAALNHPTVFGNVLTQSGSFSRKPDHATEHEWLINQFVDSPKLPLRFYQDVGVYEGWNTPGFTPNQVTSNRHFRNVLRAKGYPLHYAEYNGGHDFVNWRGTFADGLMALIDDDLRDMDAQDTINTESLSVLI
ncbi:MAG: alpha/beta hydrolase-fold protein [Chloroflexota bacterium]